MQPFPKKPGRAPKFPNEGGAQKKFTVNLTPAMVALCLKHGATVSQGINNILRSLDK